jgi:hypothetical protein
VGSIPTLGSMQKYSRLATTEEKRNFRNAFLLIALSVVAIVALIIFGFPLVGRVASFVSGLKDSGTISGSNDKTPPAPPKFNSIVDFTNQQYVTVGGNSEPGATLKLTFNGEVKETLIDKEGKFTFSDLNLKEGENNLSAVAVDSAGNISNKSTDKVIIMDAKPPEINLESPTDGTKFYGSTQRQINIKGKTDFNSNITINDRLVSMDDDGNFNYPITLNAGDNVLIIKVTDPAGNTAEKSLTVNFSE